MQTWHIHISGLVQGVGFRPWVYRLATAMGVKGMVYNSTNGVHIMATANLPVLQRFYRQLITAPPPQAIAATHRYEVLPLRNFDTFHIVHSEESYRPDLMVTPDFGMCDDCRRELFERHNRRYRYPFTTCTHCGPRYSIIKALPYDREHTSMAMYDQCRHCKKEYHDPQHRRYYSQTNSCPQCSIAMHLYNNEGENICNDANCILLMVKDALHNGHIVAVKGIGGYLLLCDATNYFAISTLRERKRRPSKPLAVMYPSLKIAEGDVVIQAEEKAALESSVAPIVLCRLRENPASGICTNIIAPGLQKLGVMLPYAPLFALIAHDFGKPLIATSGNISGAPIIFQDDQALEMLGEVADFVLGFERDIVVPQDDSVMQFTAESRQPIILRRSRGWAPNYYPAPFRSHVHMLAFGAEMKSSFGLLQHEQCYISQYLGNQDSYEAQQAFRHTLQHLTQLLRFDADLCLVDKHPLYHVSEAGRNFAAEEGIPCVEVQHHEAHFAAVLSENDLLDFREPVLGVIWDGTGYGHDGNIWGGEFFLFQQQQMHRYAQLNYFPVLMGDKMAKEPRLSALSLCHYYNEACEALKPKFSETAWRLYTQQLLYQQPQVFTSSMGRLLDGIASLLGIADVVSYEGEAAMKLEALASTVTALAIEPYPFKVFKNIVYWKPLLEQVMTDRHRGTPLAEIAYKVHLALANLVEQIAMNAGVQHIAFSGGVMQNALLVDLLMQRLGKKYQLWFHRRLSPNDECIAAGQLAWMYLREKQATLQSQITKPLVH